MEPAPQERISLGEAAYHRLRADIVACRLAPGQLFTEKQMAAETGYGMSPLRDALTRLDHDGLVRTLPRKGYQVSPLTPKTVDDLFGLWRLVAPEMVRRGLQNGTPEQITRLRAGFRAMAAIHTEPSTPDTAARIVEMADETWGLLAEAADNSYIAGLFHRLSGEIARVWAFMETTEANPGSLEALWGADVLTDHDPEAAAANTAAYIDEVHERIVGRLVRLPSVMRAEVTSPGRGSASS